MDSQLHAIENQGYHRTLKGNRLSAVAGNITHDTLLRTIAKKTLNLDSVMSVSGPAPTLGHLAATN